MEDSILIIFSKDPIVGRVKTRIGQVIGMDNAREIYLDMLQYTRDVVGSTQSKKVLFTPSGRKSFSWGEMDVYKQHGRDLGERMKNSIEEIFNNGAGKVCLIGCDNFEITSQTIEEAFESLRSHDIVLGPSEDGGYYLVGMNQSFPQMFFDIEWSTNKVLNSTVDILKRAGKSVFMLPQLRDCDEMEDIPDRYLKRFVVNYE